MHHNKTENLCMKINKNFLFHKKIIILIITIISVVLVGCGYTREEKERMEEYKKQAEQNAIAYIEEKYNFTPSIESLNCDFIDPSPIPDFTPSPSGDVYVNANDGSQSFSIYITGIKQSTSGKDDYQADAIKRDIEAYFDNIIKIDKKSISVHYGKYRTLDDKISEYYDQTNLPEIIKEYNFKIILEYIDETFDQLDDMWTDPSVKESVEILEDMDIMLISYRDDQAYKLAGGHNFYISDDPGLFYRDNQYTIYINELAKILDHEIEHTKYPVKQIDDTSYAVTDDHTINMEEIFSFLSRIYHTSRILTK